MIFRVKFDRTKNLKLRSRSNVNKGNFYYFSFPPAIYGLKKKTFSGEMRRFPKAIKMAIRHFAKCKWSTIAHFWLGRTQIMVCWKCIVV